MIRLMHLLTALCMTAMIAGCGYESSAGGGYENGTPGETEMPINDDPMFAATAAGFAVDTAKSGTLNGHYYDKGTFSVSKAMTNYDTAFSDKADNDQNIEISSWITIYFNADADPATITPSAVSITRPAPTVSGASAYPTSVEVETEYIAAERKLIIKPQVRFYGKQGKSSDANELGQTWWDWKAIKPGMTYTIVLSSSIKDTAGRSLTVQNGVSSWTFTTSKFDYGLYWFGANGACAKYIPGRANWE